MKKRVLTPNKYKDERYEFTSLFFDFFYNICYNIYRKKKGDK